MIRLSDFILHKVVKRRLPTSLPTKVLDRKPSVVMKMDIEGSELEVLTDLVVTGALKEIDLAMVEYHPDSFEHDDARRDYILGLQKSVETLNYMSRTLGLNSPYNVIDFDDESYYNVKMPLPSC